MQPDTIPEAAHAATDLGAANQRARRAMRIAEAGPAILAALAGVIGAVLCIALIVHVGCSL